MTEPCTVTGVLRDAAGDLLTSTKLSFQRLALLQAVEGDTVVAPVFGTALAAAETVTTDGTTAAFTIDLMPGVYRLSYQGGAGIEAVSFAVPVAETADLSTLIGQATTIDSTIMQTVLGYKNDAEAAAVATAADALATAADRVQTGLDRAAAASSAAQAGVYRDQAATLAAAAGAPSGEALPALPDAGYPADSYFRLLLGPGIQIWRNDAGTWTDTGIWERGPKYDSFLSFISDDSTFPAGTIIEVQGITASYTATDSTGTLGQANAGGQEWDVWSLIGDVRAFGAKGDGLTDDTAAFLAQKATKQVGFVPYGDYMIRAELTFDEGGLIGAGWSENGEKARLIFYDLTATDKGAINTRWATNKNAFVRLENLYILASSWDGVTGCLGYGLDLEAPVIMRNVSVQKFKKSNIFLHHNSAGALGPYESVLQSVRSHYSGEHGVLVGAGANAITLIGLEAKWNGATTYGVAPAVAGIYDGLHVTNTAAGYPNYTPEALTVIGGDCSYNSRYGWNFDTMRSSGCVSPGYAEHNLVKEARIGDILDCLITFSSLLGVTAGFLNEQTYAPYFYRNTVYIGGKKVHPADDFSLVANPSAEDEVGGVRQNAPTRDMLLSRSNTESATTKLMANRTPDGTAVDKGSETAVTLGGAGAFAIGIGSGSRHLKITPGVVRLPDQYHRATSTGWNAGTLLRGVGTAAPVSGTYVRGDYIENTLPSPGGYMGWVCVSAGSPGVSRGFGLIET